MLARFGPGCPASVNETALEPCTREECACVRTSAVFARIQSYMATWTDDETTKLFEVWGDDDIQRQFLGHRSATRPAVVIDTSSTTTSEDSSATESSMVISDEEEGASSTHIDVNVRDDEQDVNQDAKDVKPKIVKKSANDLQEKKRESPSCLTASPPQRAL